MTQTLSNILVILTCAGSLTFCGMYALFSSWFKSAMGRNVMALMGAIGLFLTLAILRMIWPHIFDDKPWLRPVVWSVICAIVWWRVALLVRTQFLRRRDERDSR